MHLKLLLVLVSVTAAAAQLHCDPTSQYEQDGRCCNKCRPGTSMSVSLCEEPQCKECDEDEYQETFTTEATCQRQPYCDPNKNFAPSVSGSKQLRSRCVCQLGFHCSSQECLTCVPHTRCPPGFGAHPEGNQTHDTVCAECPDGTFSSEDSWNGVCQKWTDCPDGFYLQHKGTQLSDSSCEKGNESSTTMAVILTLGILLIFIISAVACWRKGGKTAFHEGKLKNCFQKCSGRREEPPRDAEVGVAVQPQTPEETEDQLSLGVTVNGNTVVQEQGKVEVLSREESVTQDSESETVPLHSTSPFE